MKDSINRFETKLSNFGDVNDGFIRATANILTEDQVANGFRFLNEAIEKSRKQWDYVPVVAEYIEEKEDVGSHGGKITVKDGEIEYERTTIPMGVVIAGTDRYEDITCLNGETKKYFCVDVYLWYENFKKELDMFRKGKTRPQSMEVKISESEFVDGVEEVKDFSPVALCILGKDVPPAFKDSKVKVSFQSDEFKANFDKLLSALDTYIDAKTEGGKHMSEEDKDNKDKTECEMQDKDDVNDDIEDEPKDEEDMKKKKCETVNETKEEKFELSHDNIRNLINLKIDNKDDNMERMYDIYAVEVFDDYFIACDYSNNPTKYFRKKYTVENNDVVVDEDSKEEVFSKFLTKDELDKLESIKTEYDDLKQKYDSVNKKYTEIINKEEYAKKQELINSFSKKLTQKEINDHVADINNFTLEEIDEKLTIALGKKVKTQDVKTEFNDQKQNSMFSNLSSFSDNSPMAKLARKIKNNK